MVFHLFGAGHAWHILRPSLQVVSETFWERMSFANTWGIWDLGLRNTLRIFDPRTLKMMCYSVIVVSFGLLGGPLWQPHPSLGENHVESDAQVAEANHQRSVETNVWNQLSAKQPEWDTVTKQHTMNSSSNSDFYGKKQDFGGFNLPCFYFEFPKMGYPGTIIHSDANHSFQTNRGSLWISPWWKPPWSHRGSSSQRSLSFAALGSLGHLPGLFAGSGHVIHQDIHHDLDAWHRVRTCPDAGISFTMSECVASMQQLVATALRDVLGFTPGQATFATHRQVEIHESAMTLNKNVAHVWSPKVVRIQVLIPT